MGLQIGPYSQVRTLYTFPIDLAILSSNDTQAVIYYNPLEAAVFNQLHLVISTVISDTDTFRIQVGTVADSDYYADITQAFLDGKAAGEYEIALLQTAIAKGSEVLVTVTGDASETGKCTVIADIGVTKQAALN